MRRALLLAAALIAVAPVAAQHAGDLARQAEAERARRELDRAAAEAQARASADAARIAREDADRLAAAARWQATLEAEYARRRSEAEAEAQAARSEADLARRGAEARLRSAEDEARRAPVERPAATAPSAPIQPSTTAPRRRGPVPPVPTNAGAVPVIAMPEGVALCQREGAARWRCTGPLRVAVGDIAVSRAAAVDACGAAPIRDLGTVRGLRAFGCGYGLNPRSAAPGNRDVPALFGVEVRGRLTFRCTADIPAGCRRR